MNGESKLTQTININTAINSTAALSPETGLVLHAAIVQRLNTSNEIIELDFSGLRLVISAFLNTSIGKLVEHYGVQELKERLHFKNCDVSTLQLIDKVLSHSETYYKK